MRCAAAVPASRSIAEEGSDGNSKSLCAKMSPASTNAGAPGSRSETKFGAPQRRNWHKMRGRGCHSNVEIFGSRGRTILFRCSARLSVKRPECNGCNLALMAVSDDGKHSRQSGNFIRRPLRITAGHNNTSLRIVTLDAANVGAGVAIGFRGDGAGIDHHDVGLCGGRTGPQGF